MDEDFEDKIIFSLFLILMDTEDLLVRYLERGMLSRKPAFNHKLKYEFNFIKSDVQRLKTRFEIFEDELFRLEKYKSYDDFRADANFLARVNLLVIDRCQGSAAENLLINHLKRMPGNNLIRKETIEEFRLK